MALVSLENGKVLVELIPAVKVEDCLFNGHLKFDELSSDDVIQTIEGKYTDDDKEDTDNDDGNDKEDTDDDDNDKEDTDEVIISHETDMCVPVTLMCLFSCVLFVSIMSLCL